MIDETFIRDRLTQLRMQKHVTEHRMSLEMNHCRGYIHSITTGKFMPSMSEFLSICEYLGVTPASFFNPEKENSALLDQVLDDLKRLDEEDLRFLSYIISHIASQKDESAEAGSGPARELKREIGEPGERGGEADDFADVAVGGAGI